MADLNPYAPPKAHVDDTLPADTGEFIARGRAVPAGHGWTWITDGWALFRRQPLMMIAVGVLYVLIFFALPQLVPIVGGIAAMLLLPIFQAGVYEGCRALTQGSRFEFGHLLVGFQNTGPLLRSIILVFALGTVAVIPGIAVISIAVLSGGFDPAAFSQAQDWRSMLDAFERTGVYLALGVLLIMALTVPVAMAWWFAVPLIMFHKMGARASMKSSFSACLKNFVPYLLYGVILVVFYVLALIPVGLGLLIFIPVAFASIYTAYRDIFFTR